MGTGHFRFLIFEFRLGRTGRRKELKVEWSRFWGFEFRPERGSAVVEWKKTGLVD